MVSLQYKGRIHKAKFTLRSLRYIVSDQAARAFPALQRRWLLPVESRPICEAALSDFPMQSAIVAFPLPDPLAKLGLSHTVPLQLTDHVYTLSDVFVTGWAGAMIQDGLLLTVRPQHNWVSALRAVPYRVRSLGAEIHYFNLLAPIPARGHIFHWLFNSILPLIAYLESEEHCASLGLIVNGRRSAFQDLTIDYLIYKYGIKTIEPVQQNEAVRVPLLKAAIPVPYIPRALQSPLALDALNDLGAFVGAGGAPDGPRKLYVSRNDARLRRVLNEDSLLPLLEAQCIGRVCLSGLPLATQVRLFRDAELIVAPHGAGLAHIAWCKPGTRVIEFFPDPNGPRGRVKNASSDYWLISQLRDLSYSCHLAGPVETRADGFRISEELISSISQ